MKEYTEAALTKDEEQLQHLVQIVSRHRKMLPKLNSRL